MKAHHLVAHGVEVREPPHFFRIGLRAEPAELLKQRLADFWMPMQPVKGPCRFTRRRFETSDEKSQQRIEHFLISERRVVVISRGEEHAEDVLTVRTRCSACSNLSAHEFREH